MPLFTPIGGGGIGKATVTGTTGSPTVDTTSRPGKTIYKFTGTGSITLGTPGYCEVLVIAGGGASGLSAASDFGANGYSAGGGAGGLVYSTTQFLPAGTHTVTVGAGAAGDNEYTSSRDGSPSRIGSYVIALGGGSGGGRSWTVGYAFPHSGGSGGGNGYYGGSGLGLFGQGNNGGGGGASAGGGGGAGAAGVGGAGGAGLSVSITGTAVTYAGGGAPYNGTAGSGGGGASDSAATANTGGGGGGGWNGSKSGGSGYVVVVIG